MEITHRFFRVRASAVENGQRVSGHGYVCVAARPCRNGQKFRVAVSFKNPADKLNRERGAQIAAGRLRSHKAGRNFLVTTSSLEEAIEQAATFDIFERKRAVYRHGQSVKRTFAPDWLCDAVIEKGRALTAVKR